MSEQNVEVVRQPVTVRAHTRRRLEERLGLRFPRALALLARLVWRFPVRSRLRQAIILRAVQLGFEATNRGDYEAAFGLYHPDCEAIFPPQIVGLGEDPLYRRREERIAVQQRWTAEWGELRFEPEEIIHRDPRVLVIGRMKGSGLRSGAAVDNDWAVLLTISAGRVIRDQPFLSHEDALEAAGLSE